jgi:hypothetical protein
MDEARAVLARLERIEALETSGAPAAALLPEVRALLVEAEVWVRRERAGCTWAAEEAIERSREALGREPAYGNPPISAGENR